MMALLDEGLESHGAEACFRCRRQALWDGHPAAVPVLEPREDDFAPNSDWLAGVFSRRYLGYSPPASLGEQHAGWYA
jgi:hypothetical protein